MIRLLVAELLGASLVISENVQRRDNLHEGKEFVDRPAGLSGI